MVSSCKNGHVWMCVGWEDGNDHTCTYIHTYCTHNIDRPTPTNPPNTRQNSAEFIKMFQKEYRLFWGVTPHAPQMYDNVYLCGKYLFFSF
jgi:hypothetical protein